MELRLTSKWQDGIDALQDTFSHANPAQPGLSFSIKTTWQDFSNHAEPVLLFAQADWVTGTLPQASDWTAYRLTPLARLIQTELLQSESIQEALSSCILQGSHLPLSPSVLLHTAAPCTYTSFTQPLPLLAAFCQADGEENLNAWLGERAQILPFLSNLPELCRQIGSQLPGTGSIVLMNLGLLVSSENMIDCVNTQDQFSTIIETHLPLPEHSDITPDFSLDAWEILPGLRADYSRDAGTPLVLHLDQSPQAASLLNDYKTIIADLLKMPLPDFVARGGIPLRSNGSLPPNLEPHLNCPAWVEFEPRQTLYPDLGFIAAGRSVPEARQTARVAATAATAVQMAARTGNCKSLDAAKIQKTLQWQTKPLQSSLPFAGEIALVTGAASGIGKACAGSLLSRGAVVVGLDINPVIQHSFDHPNYLGLVCDITSEENIKACLRDTVREFGGLDMLVLNAGMFPGGCDIQSIALADFTRVINVNLSANLVLMREAYPLLKKAPRYGRVVIIGSKNTKAPGPGAVAYSTSKAALTQMARVAAMEWAPENIRVNVIHPDAVFDTALYTEEVLIARALTYGISVEQYKKRNMLKTEITSYDVGEMVAEMCGPLFRVVTGAQIQFDGGNERTI